MNILLSEILPLRTTQMLGNYAENAVLAQRYGDLTTARFTLVKLTPTQYVAAGHAMEITGVFVDDQRTAGWNYAIASDDLGNVWTVVNFAAAVQDGSVVTAVGRGKLNPDTGALLENPAEIIEDLSRLAGRADSFPALRSECAAAGIRIAGSVDELVSVRAAIDKITEAIAAIWTPENARLYPTSAVTGAVLELTAEDAGDLNVSATLVDTADILRLYYDVAEATGRPQHYIELTASPMRYGGVVASITSNYLRSPASAELIGRSTLERMAGERYDVSFSTLRTDIRPGSWWRLVAHPEWTFSGDDPLLMIISVEVSPDAATAQVTAETVLLRPTVTVTAHSIALPDTSDAGIDFTFKDGIFTMIVRDNDGHPLTGARVSLDGSPAKTTDQRGSVSFTTKPGHHVLAIEAAGFTPTKQEFDL